MKKVLIWLFLVTFATGLAFAQGSPPSTVVALTGSTPQLTAVDPYANAVNSADGLKPYRPFWYSVDQKGLTILRLEDNAVVAFVPWPATISVVQPNGEYVDVPAPAAGWEPVSMLVTYPTDEALASNSETPPTFVYVVMAHSGFEWQSDPTPPAGRDPNLRDMLVPSTNPATESSMVVSVDVSDPTFDPAENAMGPIIAGAILGHGAGQMAYDPGTDLLYVGNLQSTSLPTNLQSFVSVISALAPPVAEAASAGPPVPEPPLVNMCGPEHPDEGLLIGEPYVWPCTESGDGPAVWEFSGLPSWLTAHQDKLTGQLDGLLYGVPPFNGTWYYQARVTDYGDPEMGPLTSDWVTFTLNVIPTGVASEVEAGFEAGIPGGQGVGGTGSCTPAPTSSPGSIVPAWIDIQPALLNGVLKGCYVMGTAPISGEYYEFAMPYFHFNSPFETVPVILSGNVVGSYMFDPLPAGVSISGLAWHQIEKIHDPSTEADILNVELIGVEPFTGQLYRILPPQGSLEVSGAVGPPEVSVETDQITPEGQPLLTPLKASRPDIGAYSGTVAFGDLVVEADRDIYVSAPWILDSVNNSFIAIGGPSGSPIENGALIKVSGSNISAISLPGVQGYYLGLNSNLAPAIPGVEPGQQDNGLLWVTGTNTGNVAVVDTAGGQVTETMAVSGASSLGGVSVDTGYGFAYVADQSLGSVTIFGTGTRSQRAPVIWSGITTQFNVGSPSSFTVMATGLPMPKLSYTGTLPSGVTFTDNGNGNAILGGTPAPGTQGDYLFNITASNGVSPDATQAFTLTIGAPPVFTSANTTTFTVGSAGSFMVTTNGAPSITVLWCTNGADPAGACTLPGWLTFVDNEDGTSSFTGTPPPGSEGTYTFTLWATTGVPPDASQVFTLVVTTGSGTDRAPAITSASTATFTVSEPASFQVTATGWPTPTLSETGALPNGIIFVDNHNGTAALAGMPAAGTEGTYPLTITAANGVLPNATQNFTLTVNAASQAAPTVTLHPSNQTVTAGQAATFMAAASGDPTPTVQWQLSTDYGMSWSNLAGATSTSYATPATTTSMSGNQYRAVFTNSGGTANSNPATLTVNPALTAPVITSANSTTFNVGVAGSFTVTATGSPTPTVSYWGTLPAGVTFRDNGNGTATLAGTPTTAGSYMFTITATNGASPNATQNFTLIVNGIAPAITSGNATTFTVGSAGSFRVSATGSPTPQLSAQGALPSGVTFVDNGNGTATLAGTPAAGTAASYPLVITASNAVSPNATQNFTLTVNPQALPLAIVAPAGNALPNGTAGQDYSYQMQAQGGSQPYTWSLSGRLPGGLRLSSAGLISGRAGNNSAGTYTFTVRVTDSARQSDSKSLTLTINVRPPRR